MGQIQATMHLLKRSGLKGKIGAVDELESALSASQN